MPLAAAGKIRIDAPRMPLQLNARRQITPGVNLGVLDLLFSLIETIVGENYAINS